MTALARATAYGAWRRRPRGAIKTFPDVRLEIVRRVIDGALARGHGWLTPAEAKALVEATGLSIASTALAGYAVVQLKSADNGEVDMEDLARHLDADVAAFMITQPNTLGLFESRIHEITELCNAKGVQVAANVDDLHSANNKLGKENSLTEKGTVVNGRGDNPNMHDILTGSQTNGTAFTDGMDHTCSNWTSSAEEGSAQVGHHDRQGGGADPMSWNSAHGSRGCGQQNLVSTGGNGFFYCFAID